MTRVSPGARRWVAIGLLVACYGMVAFSIASAALPGGSALPDRPSIVNFIAAVSVFVALPSVGAVLALLRPANPIGWLFLACGAGFIFSIFTTEYVGRAIYAAWPLPAATFVDWLGAWIGTLSIGLAIVWIPLLFPDGHLPSPRWRPVAWAAAAFIGLGALAQAIVPDANGYGGQLPNPVAVDGLIGDIAAALAVLYFPAMAVLGVLALASLVVRFRRSRDAERAQLKWFLFAVTFFVVAVVAAVTTESELSWYAVVFGLASLPVAAAIAILRYHLYEIDRLVSRSIAYAVLTGGLIVTFVVVNLAMTTIFSSVTNVDSAAVAAATLIVAALFTPLRRRIQRVVDRRFDRARYDSEQTAVAFSTRLRDEVDLPAVTADLDATVRAAMAPTTVDVWLRGVARGRAGASPGRSPRWTSRRSWPARWPHPSMSRRSSISSGSPRSPVSVRS